MEIYNFLYKKIYISFKPKPDEQWPDFSLLKSVFYLHQKICGLSTIYLVVGAPCMQNNCIYKKKHTTSNTKKKGEILIPIHGSYKA